MTFSRRWALSGLLITILMYVVVSASAGAPFNVPIAARGAAIGEGTNDWKALFEAYETVGGTEWYIVEYESGNAMEKIKTCIDNLHKMGK